MSTDSCDLFVIGGGSGGVRAARIASEHGARVLIAEEDRYGGTCVVRGCVPKKLFVYASEMSRRFSAARGFGWRVDAHFDWPTLRDAVAAETERLSQVYRRNLERAGVEVLDGRARIAAPDRVTIGGREITCQTILVASGGVPDLPEFPGRELVITSDDAFGLEDLPGRIAVVGGGYIGIEFAHIFAGLGRAVTLVHHRDRVLRGFDDDLRTLVTENLRAAGIELLMDTEVAEVHRTDEGLHFTCDSGNHHVADLIMFATGRVPNTGGFGLEEVGVTLGARGQVEVDELSRTSVEGIYAVGDCTDRMALTPVAIREGQAFADTVFGNRPTPIELPPVPTAVFAQPPMATIGLTESEARARGEVHIYRSHFTPMFHSLSGTGEKMFMKLVVDGDSQRVLGAHMIGSDAPEIIQALAIAISMGATKADLDRTVALHPTSAEELVLMRTRAS